MNCRRFALAAVVLLAAGGAMAQDKPAPAAASQTQASPPESSSATSKKAGEIVSQPVRDLGADKAQIPPVLQAAVQNPYSLSGLKTCRQLAAAVTALNEALGPDFTPGAVTKENKAGKLAEAGGKTVVNSIIPFRSLVREISGAAPAQRSLNAAVDAGLARRGFLRGVHLKQGCRTSF